MVPPSCCPAGTAWRRSEPQPAHRQRPLHASAAQQCTQQAAGEGQPGDWRTHRLADRRWLHQAQALRGSGLMILLATDEGFEIRHSISWATVQ